MLPAGLILAYYGDDFTGSTDVMEALSASGLRTVLFLDAPSPQQLKAYDGVRAVGVAGRSRSLPRGQMDEELQPMFERLKALSAPLIHYKVCSTFDSSPETGSIGRAVEIGQDVLQSPVTPMVVGAPSLGRYCIFGNLFARSGLDSEVFRLDRHPTMRTHPVTPMQESDLRRLLAMQTSRSIGLLDITELAARRDAGKIDRADAALERLTKSGAEIVLFDVSRDEELPTIGRLIWKLAGGGLFAVGSSGLEYALTAWWRQEGWLPDIPGMRSDSVGQVVVVSGSCSPVTARQIAWAVEKGFVEVALEPAEIVDPSSSKGALAAAMDCATEAAAEGRSIILHTSLGPDDARIALTGARLRAMGVSSSEAGRETAERIGRGLGEILGEVVRRSGIRRAVAMGGDTSSYLARALKIQSLEMVAPCAPGSPLCRVFAPESAIDGMEIVFKGGQVGTVDFLECVREGTGGPINDALDTEKRV